MPYQGNTPAENYVVTVKDSFSGNGAATAFTLSQPTVTNDVRVVVENVVQDPTVAYAVSGTTLTFTSAPVSGTSNIYVIHLGPAVQQVAPPSTISNATTFESNVSVQGLFNSVGIDDNADATAITIDSSEVVLVGKTSNTFSQQGVALRANNDSQITRDGGHPLSLNRTSSDGAILNLYKDGTTVGSVGLLNSNNLTVSGTVADHGGLQFATHCVIPMEANADSNGTIDLGASGSQFKDLYLSGGVVFGPASASTVSSQTLDSYEEGTWTPSLGGNAQYNIQAGRYRKVGAIVFVYLELRANVLGTGSTTQISGLPFSAGSSAGITPAYYDGAATAIFNLMGNLQNTTIALYGRTSAVNYASQTPAFFQDNARIYMTATYETAS
jgi:hypothetical protein